MTQSIQTQTIGSENFGGGLSPTAQTRRGHSEVPKL